MQKSYKLHLFYQIVKIHEFLKYTEGQGRRRPCHWTIYPGAVSAYHQRRTEPVVLDTKY